MRDFEPFDKTFRFDESILTENFPNYMLPSILSWIFNVMVAHKLYDPYHSNMIDTAKLVNPINRMLRTTFRSKYADFIADIQFDLSTFRNVLSYLLQRVSDANEGKTLENILYETSSAYAVEFKEVNVKNGAIGWKVTKMKLVYRVPPIVKKQALEVMRTDQLLTEAWDFHYGIDFDDEKTVTRCTDVLSGLLRDKYYPNEKKPQLGKLLKQLIENKDKIILPADTLYNKESLLKMMVKFSEKRNNHQKGTGTKPSHEEAGFVLHFTIMLYQLFRSKND
ncbi:MAG: hypothetical protein KDJ52_26375 [Anaerolineae bacterium]|nr:hypothetical protein [Candidatus Saccharibacteria bacterium]MCB0212896.1 hypothetical protein [Anaerolineae bacterium]